MRAAIGQRVYRVVGLLQRQQEFEVAVRVIQHGEVDEPGRIVAAQHVIRVFLRLDPGGSGAGGNGFVLRRFVVEIVVHLVHRLPSLRDGHDHGEDIDRRFGIVVFLRQELRLERRIEQPRLLRGPVEFGDGLPARAVDEGVHSALPRHDDAVAAQRDLGDDVRAIVVFGPHGGNLFVERHFLGDGLQRGEGYGQAGFAAEAAHPAELVPVLLHVARHLEHAVARTPHRPAELDQFIGIGRRTGDEHALDILVQHRAAGRKAEGACAYAVFDNGGHRLDVVPRRDRARRFPVAEDVGAHRAVRHVGSDIDGAGQALQLVEIFGEGFPVPADPFGQCGAGNILDPLHQADQPIVLVRFRRREADAAIAHDNGRDAVPARRGHFLVPRGLSVVMRMDIDEAWRDDKSGGVDLLACGSRDVADRGDQPFGYPDVTGEPFRPGPVPYGSAANDEVVCRHVLLSQALD